MIILDKLENEASKKKWKEKKEDSVNKWMNEWIVKTMNDKHRFIIIIFLLTINLCILYWPK